MHKLSDLKVNSRVSELTLFNAVMSGSNNVECAVNYFNQHTQCPGLILLDDMGFSGMISRKYLFESLSKPFAPELYLKKTLTAYYNDQNFHAPSMLTDDLPITEAAIISLKREKTEVTDPLVVKTRGNRYSLIDSQELLLAQSYIHSLTIQSLEQANDEIQSQKKIIEEINTHLTDSINYAKNIQDSVLPIETSLNEILGEHFILFLPKDNVSGDFYWGHKIGNKVIAAVVDCTGHGVPGAFMLMIGNILLNQIIVEKQITDPSRILEALDAGVRFTLKQDRADQRSRDGMDAAIVVIDHDTNEITFAGAKRSLHYFMAGALHEVRSNHRSIGGKQKEVTSPFTSKQITIEKSVNLYLSTDGYCDQNDKERTRFGSKRYQSLLQSIQDKTMAEQKQTLNEELVSHQSGTEQRDDIIVMGIQITIN